MRPALRSPRERYGLPGWFTAGALLAAFPGTAFAAGVSATIEPLMTLGAVALALAAGVWALAQLRVIRLLRRRLREAGASARAAVGARDALIAAGRDPVVAWGGEETPAKSYGPAESILESCLAGADAIILAEALDALADR